MTCIDAPTSTMLDDQTETFIDEVVERTGQT